MQGCKKAPQNLQENRRLVIVSGIGGGHCGWREHWSNDENISLIVSIIKCHHYINVQSFPKGVMYVYLLGLAVSNLCVLITAVPALFEMGGVKFAVMDEASIQTSSFSFNPEQIIINTAPLMVILVNVKMGLFMFV